MLMWALDVVPRRKIAQQVVPYFRGLSRNEIASSFQYAEQAYDSAALPRVVGIILAVTYAEQKKRCAKENRVEH